MITINGLKFKEGNTRSLAMSLAAAFKADGLPNPDQKAWEIARAMEIDFTRGDVEKYLISMNSANPERATKKKSEPATKGKTGTSINAQARELLLSGKTVTEVSKALGKSYQRIKNVQKLMSQGDKPSPNE